MVSEFGCLNEQEQQHDDLVDKRQLADMDAEDWGHVICKDLYDLVEGDS